MILENLNNRIPDQPLVTVPAHLGGVVPTGEQPLHFIRPPNHSVGRQGPLTDSGNGGQITASLDRCGRLTQTSIIISRRSAVIVIRREKGESVVIGDDIILTVIEVRGDKVRLGIEHRKGATVPRLEVYEAILSQQEVGQKT